jgi:hypothetical protein
MSRGSVSAPFRLHMRRAASTHGAGHTITGFAPLSAPKTTISNRNFCKFETRVTHRKRSPDPISNRNFHSTNSAPRWGRHSCLRNAAHPSMNCARTTSTRRVAQAGVGLCAVASPPLTSSRGPFTGQRISLRLYSLWDCTTAHTTACATGYLTNLPPISNRSAPRLEMPESYRKQTTDPLSNRHKFTHQSSLHSPHELRLPIAGSCSRGRVLRFLSAVGAIPTAEEWNFGLCATIPRKPRQARKGATVAGQSRVPRSTRSSSHRPEAKTILPFVLFALPNAALAAPIHPTRYRTSSHARKSEMIPAASGTQADAREKAPN